MSEFPGQQSEGQSLKLTEEEVKLVAKLLSDPTYFPVEFRTWLKNYIEGAGITINTSQIRGGAGGNVNLPAGIILPYAGDKIAANVLPCDGQAVSRSIYDGLFEAIGTLWGPGDGSSTFNVPDLRDRALYGVGSRIGTAETDGVALGSRGGPNHHHYFGQSSDGGGNHSHGVSADGLTDSQSHDHAPAVGSSFATMNFSQAALGSGGTSRYLVGGGTSGTDTRSHSHGVHVDGGTDDSGDHGHWVEGLTDGGFDDKPSYAAVRYAITTGKSS